MAKHVLIVYAHSEPKSFNFALKETAVKTLEACGCNVTVSDLYSMQFKPTTTKSDIIGNPPGGDEGHFDYCSATAIAAKESKMSADIQREWEKFDRADLVVFQFPLTWLHMPAIMKGWMDRILISGRAYDGQHMFSNGYLKGKRAMLSFTTGGPQSLYSNKGICGDMEVFLWPIHNGILNFTGMDVLAANICYSVQYIPQQVRESMLDAWSSRLKGIFQEEPLHFLKWEDFEGFEIKPESLEREKRDKTLPLAHHDSGVFFQQKSSANL